MFILSTSPGVHSKEGSVGLTSPFGGGGGLKTILLEITVKFWPSPLPLHNMAPSYELHPSAVSADWHVYACTVLSDSIMSLTPFLYSLIPQIMQMSLQKYLISGVVRSAIYLEWEGESHKFPYSMENRTARSYQMLYQILLCGVWLCSSHYCSSRWNFLCKPHLVHLKKNYCMETVVFAS